MTTRNSRSTRKPYSFRLSDEEVEKLRAKDSNLSRAVRRLIHGPEPEPQPYRPTLAESLELGRVFFSDASGTYELAPREVAVTSQTWPPLPTYGGPIHTAYVGVVR